MSLTDPDSNRAPTVEFALVTAERRGFRLAMIGRACALVVLSAAYSAVWQAPYNFYAAAVILGLAAIGFLPVALIGSRLELPARYALFAIDASAITAALLFVPVISGAEISQNLVFILSRDKYFFIIVAISMLSLSPALVIWTGLCSVAGLAFATLWIWAGMDSVSHYIDLPPTPSQQEFYDVVLSPNFLGWTIRAWDGAVIAIVTALAAFAVHRARNVTRAHAAGEEQRMHVLNVFGRYVPPIVTEQLIESGEIKPEQREATVLFADIEGFTRLSESLSAPKVINLLNDFFGAATAIIHERDGVVVNYVGDALIAAFNTPLPASDHGARAIDAAYALLDLVSSRDFDGHRIRLRVGVATGPVAAGTVGGAERQTYTVYGDTVNLAQRLEQKNKELGTRCLVTAATLRSAQSVRGRVIEMGQMTVPGRDSAVEVFSIDVAGSPSGGHFRAR